MIECMICGQPMEYDIINKEGNFYFVTNCVSCDFSQKYLIEFKQDDLFKEIGKQQRNE